ncbi:PREDICTED: quinone oxidoreductase-like protein 2 homolog [Branchiostoma belcheri]|uniref:Quinone oxidoreductase-like protein 2 homolog n=1 Tax=Branchiostoma belcheri TaxID=7741 RepID=A0A6P4YFG1_BRABE|nr:PREDICTED: quinone oxidoreductase-like protein 2 homolog [Branchiostoma belcheri]
MAALQRSFSAVRLQVCVLRSTLQSCKQLRDQRWVKPFALQQRGYRAAVCHKISAPMEVRDLPSVEKVPKGMVKVAVHSTGINFADILMVAGAYQERPELPFVPGFEMAGEVMTVGEGVTAFKEGDRVVGLPMPSGSFAEECLVNEKALFHLPASVAYTTAAAVPVSYGTALMGLTRRVNLQPGETVLVTAAAGALGTAVVDLAAHALGATVIGAAGSQEKCEFVRSRGAQHTVDYSQDSIRDRVKDITQGKGCDVAFDSVGGKVFEESLKCLAWEGRVLVAGFAGGDIPKIPANILLVKNLSAVGLYWGRYAMQNIGVLRQTVIATLTFMEEGKIKGPSQPTTFKLEQVNEAVKFITDRKSTGKVVLEVR